MVGPNQFSRQPTQRDVELALSVLQNASGGYTPDLADRQFLDRAISQSARRPSGELYPPLSEPPPSLPTGGRALGPGAGAQSPKEYLDTKYYGGGRGPDGATGEPGAVPPPKSLVDRVWDAYGQTFATAREPFKESPPAWDDDTPAQTPASTSASGGLPVPKVSPPPASPGVTSAPMATAPARAPRQVAQAAPQEESLRALVDKLMPARGAQTQEQKNRALGEALMLGGFAAMREGGKPGADTLGTIGAGGEAGMAQYLRSKRLDSVQANKLKRDRANLTIEAEIEDRKAKRISEERRLTRGGVDRRAAATLAMQKERTRATILDDLFDKQRRDIEGGLLDPEKALSYKELAKKADQLLGRMPFDKPKKGNAALDSAAVGSKEKVGGVWYEKKRPGPGGDKWDPVK